MHIAIAGNIGSGKTTLTGMLAKHFGWEPQYESVDNNPYLASFYEDMQRWSFNLQIYFLNCRFRQVTEIRKKKKDIALFFSLTKYYILIRDEKTASSLESHLGFVF